MYLVSAIHKNGLKMSVVCSCLYDAIELQRNMLTCSNFSIHTVITSLDE